jgi:hypothetical protein
MIDFADLIQKAQQHVSRDHKYFPSNTPQFRESVQAAIDSGAASPDQLKELGRVGEALRQLG